MAKIKKANKERAYCSGCGRRNGGRGGGHGGGRQGNRNKWSNDKNDGDKNDHENGVQNRGNAWMCYCCRKECGCNFTHTSGFHSARKRDPGTFALPDDHDYWKLSGKTVGATTVTGSSEGSRVGTQSKLCSDLS